MAVECRWLSWFLTHWLCLPCPRLWNFIPVCETGNVKWNACICMSHLVTLSQYVDSKIMGARCTCKIKYTDISVLWPCALTLLIGWQEGHPACKNRVMGCWHGYLSGARCRLAYGPAGATVSCFRKIQICFAFLVPAHPGSPGQRAVKCVCVRVWDIAVRSLTCHIATGAHMPYRSTQC